MKKTNRRIISIVMAAVMCFGTSVSAFAVKSASSSEKQMRFGNDGKFTILQVSDIQDGADLMTITSDYIKATLNKVQPDLVVLTGDNIAGYRSPTKALAKAAIKKVMNIFQEQNIPVAMVYGNHDDERTTASKEYQMSVYESYDCFIGCEGEYLTGCGNYNIPILSSDGTRTAFNLWMIDSLTYNDENDLEGYGCPHKDQIAWYVRTSNALKAQNNGNPVNSMVFQHIIVPEVYDALQEVPQGTEGAVEHGGKYYVLPSTAAQGSILGESCCPPNYSNGEFDAMVSQGDVVAMFFGHDHVNSFTVPYKGINLVATPGIGFRSYGDETKGSRVITIDENDTSTYETETLSYFDVFDYNDDVARYHYKAYAQESSDSTKFAAWFKYLFAVIASKFECICGLFK